ncbi:MAG: adenine phosphoribosyltransferase [Armatimonadetes bacterium]|nr:adenine phosphoribosyltransferase [Armatimonadota bacterium]
MPLLAESLIRDVPDFPKPGIVFKDITPVLASPAAMREVTDRFEAFAAEVRPDVIAGVESRGFVLGAPLAMRMGLPFAPVRKAGKLPWRTLREEYALEYGTAAIEMHEDAVAAGSRVLIVDDLLATGGTAAAAARLVERLGGRVVGLCFMVELAFLKGRDVLTGRTIEALIEY